MSARLDAGGLMCSTCHNQHSQTQSPFDRAAPASGDGRHFQRISNDANQACLDCHAAWRMTSVRSYTGAALSHPVERTLGGATYYSPPRDVAGGNVFAGGGAASSTAGNNTTLDDSSKSFGNLTSTTHYVRFTSGTNKGLTRLIAANTATQITFAAVSAPVQQGDRYEIDGDANLTNNLLLDGVGRVLCSSCHNVHFADSNAATYDDQPRAGDGKLLRRGTGDLSACQGCHNQPLHSSARLGTKHGTWGGSFTCRTCHQPHKTTSIYLVNQSIQTPNSGARAADPRSMTTGVEPYGLARSDSPGYGPCETCHTSTRSGNEHTTGTATFVAGGTTVSCASTCSWAGVVAPGWEIKRAADGPSAWTRVESVTAATITLSVGYKGTSGTAVAYAAANPRYRNTSQGATGAEHCPNVICTTCHTHQNAFGASAASVPESTGSGGCACCHDATWRRLTGLSTTNPAGQTIVSRHTTGSLIGVNDSFNQASPGATWASPLDSVPAASRSCTNMCHNDHPHTVTGDATHRRNVYQNAYDSASRSAADARMYADTDLAGDPPTTEGGLCFSCHKSPVTIAGREHVAISKTNYASSAHDYSRYYYQQHDSSLFCRNCTKCHTDGSDVSDSTPIVTTTPFGGVHFAAYDSLLFKNARAAGDTSKFACYQCHSGSCGGCHAIHGEPGTCNKPARASAHSRVRLANIFGTYSGGVKSGGQTYTHPIGTDNVHDTWSEKSSTWGDGKFLGANRHINCLDCHNTHEAGRTNHAAGTNTVTAQSPLRGASGLVFTPPSTAWAPTGASNFAWTSSVGYEYQICFKCHSSWAWGNGTPPTSPSGGYTETDQARELNPNNGRYHAVVGASKASGWGSYVSPWTSSSQLYCADCHTSDNTSYPKGAHGSNTAFILSAPWTAGASGTGQTGTSNHLCFKCHTWNAYGRGGTLTSCASSTTGFCNTDKGNLHTFHMTKNNPLTGVAVVCRDCHGRVPHGWERSYPVNTYQDPAPYNNGNVGMHNSDIPNWGPAGNWQESDCGNALCH
jgi:hypothetical protein